MFSKRGIGHVEAILSFLLFIGFVFFALYFFSPKGNTNLIDSSLQFTLNAITQNTSVKILAFSIKINRTNMQNGQNSVAVEFPNELLTIPPNYIARAETYEGKPLPTTRSGTIVYVDPGTENFVIIKFCEDFPPSQPASQAPALDSRTYILASSSTKDILSEKRMLAINHSYYTDYETLKTGLDLPGQVSFGYDITAGNYTISAPADVPVGVDVYSTITRKEILKTNGESLFGDVSVKVW